MCDFCEILKDNTKKVNWSVRSTYADDNICEYVNGENCSCCDRCGSSFNLVNYEIDGNVRIALEYHKRLKDEEGNEVVIEPFSEPVQWNHCPICGDKISKTIEEDLGFGWKIESVDRESGE